MREWTRTPTDSFGDPATHRMAAALKLDVATVVGHLLAVWSLLPAHARDGNLADVPDTLLEEWARWRGKRDVFAGAMRAHLLVNGVWELWEELNGAVLREKDADAKRQAERREALRKAKRAQLDDLVDASAERPRDRPADGSTDRPTLRTDVRLQPPGARARGNGHPIGSQPPGPGAPWCRECGDGELAERKGQRRPVRVHATSCSHHGAEASA
jgi:hypothetical protein